MTRENQWAVKITMALTHFIALDDQILSVTLHAESSWGLLSRKTLAGAFDSVHQTGDFPFHSSGT